MLKVMRDSFQHLKWILVFIVALFILFIFVDWGGAGRSGGGRRGSDLGSAAARVNGDTISANEFQRAVYYAEQRYEQLYGQKITPEMRKALRIEKTVLDELVDQQLLLQEARRLHLGATDDEVQKAILKIPVLNPDGKFVGSQLYERYILGMGYPSVADFEREIARDLTLQKMQNALANSVAVSPATAEEQYRKRTENTKIQYVLYASDRIAATVAMTPAEVESYFKSHQNKYAHGDQRRVKYLIADLATIRAKITVADADLRTYYDQNKETYKSKESVRAQHILIRVAPNASPADDAAAKAKAEDLVKQLRGGADFAALAQKFSGDPGSAARGGDVGWFERGRMVPEFENAAFGLNIGQISDPVKTQYGYHILKVNEKRGPGYRTFEEVKPEISARFVDDRARAQARDAIAVARRRIEKEKPKTEDALRAIADASPGIALNDTQWFEKSDSIFGIGRAQALADWAFAAKDGDYSDIIDTERGPIVGWLASRRAPGLSELADVRARVDADARRDKAATMAASELKAMMPVDSLDTLATKLATKVEDATVTRGGYIPKLSGDVEPVVDAAMNAAPGTIVGPIPVEQGAVIVKVLEQKKFDPAVFATEKDRFLAGLRAGEARRLETSLLERLRKEASVKLNDSLIAGSESPQV